MQLTDYKRYIAFVKSGDFHYFRFPDDFHAFYVMAEFAFGGIRLIENGEIVASSPIDHIHWHDEPKMLKHIANVFNGKEFW